MKVLLISIILLFLSGCVAYAARPKEKRAYTDHLAILAIVGEVSGEGKSKGEKYTAMIMIAKAIRNRGHVRGVYGIRAKHNATEAPYIWDMARRAWRDSAHHTDLTCGADSWYSMEDLAKFGPPVGKIETKRFLNTVFYKTTKKGEVSCQSKFS